MPNLATTVADGGRNISELRIKQGLSMRALAIKAGLSVSSVSKIERGIVKSIRPLSAQKICTALEVPFDTLFSIESPNTLENKG